MTALPPSVNEGLHKEHQQTQNVLAGVEKNEGIPGKEEAMLQQCEQGVYVTLWQRIQR